VLYSLEWFRQKPEKIERSSPTRIQLRRQLHHSREEVPLICWLRQWAQVVVPGRKFNFPAFVEEIYYAANSEINEATRNHPCEDVAPSPSEDWRLTFVSPAVL